MALVCLGIGRLRTLPIPPFTHGGLKPLSNPLAG
jgi:hypothetical protein